MINTWGKITKAANCDLVYLISKKLVASYYIKLLC